MGRPHSVRRLSKKEVHNLAVRMLRNEVYLMWANERDVTLAFPILTLAAPEWREDYVKSIGAVYSTLDSAGGMVPGRAINGHPMFFSCQFVNVKDCEDVWAEYERVKELLA